MFVPSLREKYVRLKCSSPNDVVKVRGTLRSLTVSPSSFRSFLAERTAASISLIAADTSSKVPAFTTFKSSSAVFPSLDGPIFSIVLKIPLPNFRCLCYNLFHGDVPHFRSFLQGLNKFYHERRVPAIFICRSAYRRPGLVISPRIILH